MKFGKDPIQPGNSLSPVFKVVDVSATVRAYIITKKMSPRVRKAGNVYFAKK